MKSVHQILIGYYLLWSMFSTRVTDSFLLFPRGGSIGYLAAVAMPLDLEYRNVYVAFNFEANYGIPSNDTYNDWIARWNLTQPFMGAGNEALPINGRQQRDNNRLIRQYTRSSFYRSIIGYLEHFNMNGTECLLRTICEVTAISLDENNGLFGSIMKILFMPSTSMHEPELYDNKAAKGIHEAEWWGKQGHCQRYMKWCPCGVIDLISSWL